MKTNFHSGILDSSTSEAKRSTFTTYVLQVSLLTLFDLHASVQIQFSFNWVSNNFIYKLMAYKVTLIHKGLHEFEYIVNLSHWNLSWIRGLSHWKLSWIRGSKEHLKSRILSTGCGPPGEFF